MPFMLVGGLSRALARLVAPSGLCCCDVLALRFLPFTVLGNGREGTVSMVGPAGAFLHWSGQYSTRNASAMSCFKLLALS